MYAFLSLNLSYKLKIVLVSLVHWIVEKYASINSKS